MISAKETEYLKETARQLRKDILLMIFTSRSGHPGGALSCIDILCALYFKLMRIDPQKPDWPDRDRFILSKGHACPAWYSCLIRKGYMGRDTLFTLRQLGSRLQGHPDMNKATGVDMTTGSLGQGLSAGVGMALAGKLDKKDYRVYVVVGDGEADEGQMWEAVMAAAKWKLDNLTVFMDYNGLQLDGDTETVMPLEPIGEKLRAFNWNTVEIDGHDMVQIVEAVEKARDTKGMPTWIIAKTVKGKGVSFMENDPDWHGKSPNEAQFHQAMGELNA